MAYGNRKRTYRGRRRPYRKRNYRSKAKNKQTVAIVKRVLHSQIENKQAFKSISGTRISTAMPSSIATGMYPIIPNLVSSGTGSNNSKAGQSVRPLSLRLGLQAFISDNAAGNQAPIYFDLYIFGIKAIKDSTLFDSEGPAALDNFFRPSLTGVDTAYEGRVYNWFQNVNQDVITLYHKKRFKMSPTNNAGTGGLNGEWVDNYSQYSINYTVPLTKHCAKTLKYTNPTDELPNNCALFATMVCTTAQAANNPPSQGVLTLGNVSFNSCMVYEDA